MTVEREMLHWREIATFHLWETRICFISLQHHVLLRWGVIMPFFSILAYLLLPYKALVHIHFVYIDSET